MTKTVIIMLGEDDRNTVMGIAMSQVKSMFRGLFGAPNNVLTPFHPDKQFQMIDEYGRLVRMYRVIYNNHPELFKGRKIKQHKGIAKDIARLVAEARNDYDKYLKEQEESKYELL